MDIKVTPDVKLVVGLPQVYSKYDVVQIGDLAGALPDAQLCAVITAFEEGLPQTYFLLGRGPSARAATYGGFELHAVEVDDGHDVPSAGSDPDEPDAPDVAVPEPDAPDVAVPEVAEPKPEA